MTVIAELLTEEERRALRGPDEGPNAFHGEAPDLDTCDIWMRKILAFYEDNQRDLTHAKTGGRILDPNGRPLSHEAFSEWRADKVRRGQKLMRRYRWLKEQRSSLARDRKSVARLAPNNGQNLGLVLKEATKQYGRLYNLYEAAGRFIEEDSDEAWEGFLRAYDDVSPSEGC